jgi:sugar phosphate isomerase/epimerase
MRQLSITSWSFPACTLIEAVAVSKALGIGALDLGYFYRPALDRSAILANPEAAAGDVLSHGIGVPSFYHLFGASIADRNLADAGSLDRNIADFRAVVRFCKAANIPTIFVLPGITNPGQGKADALQTSAHALSALVDIAQAQNLTLSIEPHVHSYLESPACVLELLQEVPQLRLTLDYAHFICLGFTQPEIDVLAPYAAHIHLRQARPGYLQAKLAEGVIDFAALLGLLKSLGYQGALAIEYVHQAYMNTLYDDVLTETIAMRDLVRQWST